MGDIDVVVEGNDLRLDEQSWAPFWSAFPHLIRNAVDHGLETPEERVHAGKSVPGMLRLTTRVVDESFVLELEDDGRGIQWDRVAARATRAKLAASSERDLIEALFHDGLSTKEVATEISGRGIGLSAARAAWQAMGGTAEIVSQSGKGTIVRIRWPRSAMERGADAAPKEVAPLARAVGA